MDKIEKDSSTRGLVILSGKEDNFIVGADVEELKNDQEMTSKMNKIKNILESFSKKPIDKQSIQQILKIQNLVTEVEN